MASEPFILTRETAKEYNLGGRYPVCCCDCGDTIEMGDKMIFLNDHTNRDDPVHFKCHEWAEQSKKAKADVQGKFALDFAQELRTKHDLTYGCSVNLEGAINNMFDYGMHEKGIRDVLEDIYDNLDFVEGDGTDEEVKI